MKLAIRLPILFILVLGLGSLVAQGIRKVRHEQQTRAMLLQVQAAVQDYHVDQERYIPRQELTGSQLISVLSDFGFLNELPINPWTHELWKLDGEEPDFLRYATDPNFETYALRALNPKTGEVVLEIDSVEQPSL
ncbi:MAG: hypothetical protein AAGH89_02990 [Verrucomicrobiota bacterium]